mgnify:CR=1 FL=1
MKKELIEIIRKTPVQNLKVLIDEHLTTGEIEYIADRILEKFNLRDVEEDADENIMNIISAAKALKWQVSIDMSDPEKELPGLVVGTSAYMQEIFGKEGS